MSLQGVLSDFGVADVFQLIAQQRKTGVLEIESDERVLEVYFLEGQVVRARPEETRPDGALAAFLLRTGAVSEVDLVEAWRHQEETLEPLPEVIVSQGLVSKPELEKIARLLSDETIFELFLWDEGRFAFQPQAVTEQIGDMLVGAEMVLLDALRMRDEWVQIQVGLPDLTVTLAQSVDVEVFRQRRAAVESAVGMNGDDLDRIYTRCDGRLTARRVIDLSRLGTFLGARGLVAMLREGLLHVAHTAGPSKSGRSARSRPTLPRRRQSAWVLLPTSLVAAGLLLIPPPAPRSHPLPDGTLAETREAVAMQRLEAALEVHRWRTGAYPESLEELRQGAGLFLAPLSLDRYSYSRSEGGYWLSRR